MDEVIVKDANDLSWLTQDFDVQQYRTLHEEMSFAEYIELIKKKPKITRSAYQRLYDMIMSAGTRGIKYYRKSLTHYNFFDDEELPIYGLEESLDKLMKFIRGAASGFGTEKRILLLHGPVGSSKSTICRLFKRGLERYSMTDDGAWYSYKWVNLPTGQTGVYNNEFAECPMFDDPLRLLPANLRQKVFAQLNETLQEQTPEKERISQYMLNLEGEMNPRCKIFFKFLMDQYKGDILKVFENHIRVVRKVYSETDRIGIGTFQPKDEKNQDATELTGDIDFSKIQEFGKDSDARAFNFDGELCISNRGMVEFIEIFKMDKAFLYDLLGATQEKSIKPKKFSQINIDMIILGHTNTPEFNKLKNDQTMEAFRDRTVKIDIPYLTKMSDELKILKRDYNSNKVKQHIAPHTLEIAALWAVLTRLVDDRDTKLSLVDKAKLYDGRFLPGHTEDTVKELRDKYPDEGMGGGVSVRYVQEKLSSSLSEAAFKGKNSINPFILLNAIRDGLLGSSLITNKDEIAKYIVCAELAMKELDQILKTEVQKALVGDEKAIIRLCANYIDNLVAHINGSKVINPYTGKEQEPNEPLMREIEEKIDVTDTGADDFRRSIAAFIGTLQVQGKTFTWDSNPKLAKGLQAKLFDDTRHHIKLSALNTDGVNVVDQDLQEKIDAIKQRLIKQFGYNEESAADVLNYVSSLFARGDASDNH